MLLSQRGTQEHHQARDPRGQDKTDGNPEVFVHKETTSRPVYIIAGITARGRGPTAVGVSGPSERLNWQKPNLVPVRVHRYQGSLFEVRAAGVQGANDHLADGRRENVQRADLADAWLASLSVRQKCTEIEIVSEDDQPVCAGIVHDLRVRRGRLSNDGPVNAVETRIG